MHWRKSYFHSSKSHYNQKRFYK